MGFENPIALWLSLALPLLFILTLWRLKPVRVVIPSIYLWGRIKDRNPPINALQKPRFNVLLLFQIMVVASGIIAIASPFVEVSSTEPKTVIVVIDASASMKTRVSTTKMRFDMAVEEVEKLINALQDYDTVEIYTSGSNSSYFKGDKGGAFSYLRKISVADCESDVVDVCKNVVISVSGGKNVRMFLVSDKDIDLGDVNERFIRILVGGKSDNIGITRLSVDKRADGLYDIFVAIGNFTGNEIEVPLMIVDSSISKNVIAKVGITTLVLEKVDIGSNNLIEVIIDRNDSLDVDNGAGAFKLNGRQLKVLMSGVDNRFLSKSFRAMPDTDLTVSQVPTSSGYDIYIYNEMLPSVIPKGGDIVIVNPPSDFSSFRFGKVLDSTLVDEGGNQLLRDVNIDEVKVVGAREISSGLQVEDVFTIKGKPIAVLYADVGKSILVLSFGLTTDAVGGSRWMYYPSFPIFWANYVEFIRSKRKSWISDFTTAKVGIPLLLPREYKDASIRYLANDEKLRPAEDTDGRISFIPYSVGRYQMKSKDDKKDIYVNLLSENESDNNGSEHLLPDNVFEDLKTTRVKKPFLQYFAILSVLFMIICWVLEKRMS